VNSILNSYKKSVNVKKDGDVMGVIRTLFPDITVETFLQKRTKKVKKS
jgi:hypothetical protein